MSQSARVAPARPAGALQQPPRDPYRQPANRVWSEQPTLVGVQAVIRFAREELGVDLTRSLVRRATEARRIQVFKLSAKNAYSPAGVVRFIESLARPVAGEDQ